MADKWRYKGGGFIPGVPARDLTAEEAERYGPDRLVASGLYEPPAQDAPEGDATEMVDTADRAPKKRRKKEG